MVGRELLNIQAESNKIFSSVRNRESNIEGARKAVLEDLLAKGVISDLKKQYKFEIKINDYFVCCYYADFVYTYQGKQVVEDTKNGYVGSVFKLKKKLMKAVLGIYVHEITYPKQKIGGFNHERRDSKYTGRA